MKGTSKANITESKCNLNKNEAIFKTKYSAGGAAVSVAASAGTSESSVRTAVQLAAGVTVARMLATVAPSTCDN